MGFMLRLLRRIPYFEALRSFLEQWGLWVYIKPMGAVVVAALIALWARIESSLPYWALAVLILLVTIAVLTIVMIVQNLRSKPNITLGDIRLHRRPSTSQTYYIGAIRKHSSGPVDNATARIKKIERMSGSIWKDLLRTP